MTRGQGQAIFQFVGQTVSNTGNWLTNVTLTLLVLRLTNSGLAIGLLAAVQYGPILPFSINAGVIADRHDKRNLVFFTQGLEMVESIVLACLAFMHHPPLVALFVTAGVGGSLLALDNPLRRSFVTEMVPEEDRANAVVLDSLIVNVARIIGPALASVLVITVGYRPRDRHDGRGDRGSAFSLAPAIPTPGSRSARTEHAPG